MNKICLSELIFFHFCPINNNGKKKTHRVVEQKKNNKSEVSSEKCKIYALYKQILVSFIYFCICLSLTLDSNLAVGSL